MADGLHDQVPQLHLAAAEDEQLGVGIGLVNLTNLLDPELFILGGGLVELRDLIVEPIRHWLGQLLYAPSFRPHPRLEIARLGQRAGAVGAAMLPGSVRS